MSSRAGPSKARSSKIAPHGHRQLIRMVPCIFMIRRGCVCQWPQTFLATTNARLKRLFTDTDMHDQTLREEIEDFYTYLQQLIRADQLVIPSKNYDLVLDIMVTDEERISWSYYYACHESRCLFWLETYDASYMISELFGVKSPAHVSALQLSHLSLLQFPTNFARRASVGVPLLASWLYATELFFQTADIVG
jgi:hypothetical protein